TANGRTQGFATVLRRLTLGPFQLTGVRAVILPAMDEVSQVLLGMNVLGEFELVQRGSTLTIRPPVQD
ncbi:MAG: retroviral-like aspartic protease family protein, partial [Candidatus Competibacterales bacterium]|nr:retroviral-like aspartic protease family protein [Candidatus Competibacterales bacterium]